MISVAHGLVPVASDVWRTDNTAAKAVAKAPSTADDVAAVFFLEWVTRKSRQSTALLNTVGYALTFFLRNTI